MIEKGFRSPIIARDHHGTDHELRVDAHPAAMVTIADDVMSRTMTSDATLELVFQLIKAVDRTRSSAGVRGDSKPKSCW